MSEMITITIDGQEIQAKPGQMLIDVADENNISIPRFCYHKKLSVAASCRMCLVEVEKAPKPMPACATSVMDGMIVKTQSGNARAAQKSTMEFLLINHPLDCPICDQGGECELQDVAMGFGGDVSQYSEFKRVVKDKDIGPLIAMEMTRCIHCTRCIRFSDEIAGLPELGATGRGENMQIGTYIEKSVSSELSGNVIDVCPVGALTAKPSRYTARPWELTQHSSVAAHDCVGSNIYVHTRNQQVMRVVPRDNEQINENWISDRDRFSYTSMYDESRLVKPLQRINGRLKEIDWETAINLAFEKLQAGANQNGNLAALINPQSTLEEHYLLQKMMRGLGSNNIDHRLRQTDFSMQDKMPAMPWLGRSIQSVEQLGSALLVGANIRTEQPMLNHRLRKAALNGASITSISSVSGQYNFDLEQDIAGSAEHVLHELSSVAVAASKKAKQELSPELSSLLDKVKAKKEHTAIVTALLKSEQSAVIVGVQSVSYPDFALIMQLAEAIAAMTESSLGYLSESSNTAGACLAGALPNRSAATISTDSAGQNTSQIVAESHKTLLLMGVDPMVDVASNTSLTEFADNNEFIIAIDCFRNEFMDENADLVLPLATNLETSGTFVNVEGLWQSFKGCVKPVSESRQGWKILTTLAQLLLPGDEFEYSSSTAIRDELKAKCRDIQLDNFVGVTTASKKLPTRSRSLQRISETAIYAVDGTVRHSAALQNTVNMQGATCVRMNTTQAEKLGLDDAEKVHVSQKLGKETGTAVLEFQLDDNIPVGCVWVPTGIKEVDNLPGLFGNVEVEKVS